MSDVDATGEEVPPPASIYSAVRRAHPELAAVRVRKPVLLAVSRALEDEMAYRPRSPVLFAGFQRGRFLAPALPRWRRLAARASSVVVFADVADEPVDTGAVRLARLAPDVPLRMEWAIVCDDPDFACVLSAWEVPGQHDVADPDRVFEMVWSLEPAPVRVAARTCAALAEQAGVPDAAEVRRHVETSSVADPDVRTIWQVFTRVLAHVGGAPGEAEVVRPWERAVAARRDRS